MRELGIKPEHECFDAGHVANLDPLIDMGLLEPPLQISLVMGVTGGIRPTPRNVTSMSDQIPGGAEGPNQWQVIGISRDQWKLLGAALVLGGNVRAGVEDNLYLPDGTMARSNGDLIGKARQMAEDVGRRPATVAEARELLGITARSAADRLGESPPWRRVPSDRAAADGRAGRGQRRPGADDQALPARGPAPRRGKTSRNMAYYPPEFVDRIRLIKRLQEERFMPLRAIKEVLDEGTDRAEAMLALEDQILDRALAGERTRTSAADVRKRYGVPKEVLDRLAEIGVLTPNTRGYSPSDVTIIEAIGRFRAGGYDEQIGFTVYDTLRYKNALEDLVREEVDMVMNRLAGEVVAASAWSRCSKLAPSP